MKKQVNEQARQRWGSRHHRKGLPVRAGAPAERVGSVLLRCLWMPGQLNWWIGIIFALGSLLFGVASVLSLSPNLAQAASFDSMSINAIFFAGSIPFTTAAGLQLFQATSAGTKFFAWRPHDIGWLSCVLQLIGTVLFNFNTFDAMIPSLDEFQQELLIWAPDIVGSILFLVSGYLAFIETCHAYWAWRPGSISWWVVFLNLLGCLGFMAAATVQVSTISIACTLLGAIGFLAGSLLMLPETVVDTP